MNRLLLHIGTHKTGSSAIQHWLTDRRETLQQQGIWYGATDREPYPHLPKHNSIYRALVNPIGDFDVEKTAILEDFRRSGCHTLILSEEGLSEPYHQRLARIAELRDHFRITVICFLRRQDHFLESLWNQRCREGFETRSVEDYVLDEHNLRLADYLQKLDFWAGIGDLHAVAYDEESPASVPAFARVAGLPEEDFKPIVNASPSMNRAVYCNLMNRWKVPYDAEKVSLRLMPDTRGHALGRRLRSRLLADFEESNAALARRYGIEFNEDMPDEPEQPLRWPQPLMSPLSVRLLWTAGRVALAQRLEQVLGSERSVAQDRPERRNRP